MVKDFNVGVKGIIIVDDRCLVLESSQGYFDIPGGRVDDNENLQQALIRELDEELPSIPDFKIGRLVHASRLSKDLPNGKGLALLFYKVETKSFEVKLSQEHKAFRWYSKDELSALLESDVKIEPDYYQALLNAFD